MKRLVFLVPIFLLCGCWDYTELNMQNYVLGMSVDYYDELYHVCIETVKITGEPTSLSASEGVLIESSGLTVFDAVRDAIMSAGKKLYWGHAELVVMSEVVAAEHLDAVCDVLARSQDIYSNISLAVAAKPNLARDILKSKPPSDTLVSQHIANILRNEEPSRRFIDTELWQLQRNFPYTVLPILHLDNESPVAEGGAVINNGKLSGVISGEEVQIFSLISDSTSGGYLPSITTMDGVTVTLEILRSNTTKLKNSTRLDVMVALSSADRPCNVMDKQFRTQISDKARALITAQINGLISKPFGNPLPDTSYEVHVELNSTGLIRG